MIEQGEKRKVARYLQDKATLEKFPNVDKVTAVGGLNILPENYDKFHQEAKVEDKKKIKKETKKISAEVFTDKMYQAELFWNDYPFFYNKNKLWWLWDDEEFKYERVDEVQILNLVKDHTGLNIINSTIRNEIINALKQVGRKHIPKEPEPTWIQFKDKIYDLEEKFEWQIASPDYFMTNPIPHKLGETESTPALNILFRSWVSEEHIQELYEVLAFCLVPNYFIHRMFCLIGSGANGKSTYLQVLANFTGEENITSSSLYLLLKARFEGSKLLKKLVCLMGETNFDLITNTDYLKKLTGQDLIRAEFKGKDCFDFRNYAKLIMATNSLPPTADKTEGFYRRWKIIKFPNKFNEEKEVLFNVLPKEYENLALKCLNISKRLWKKRIFTNDGDFDERKKRYEDESNPLSKFIKEEFKRDINKETLFQEFFEEFNVYLEERGKRLLSASALSRQLKNEGFTIKQMTKGRVTSKYILGITHRNNLNNLN